MQTQGTHAPAPSGRYGYTHQPMAGGAAGAALKQKLEALRPASRSFVARLFSRGKSAIKDEQLEFAQWMHTRMHYSASVERHENKMNDGKHEESERRPEQLSEHLDPFLGRQAGVLKGLLGGRRQVSEEELFAKVHQLLEGDLQANDALALLGAHSAKDFMEGLKKHLDPLCRSPLRSQELARVIYTALVSKVALTANDQAEVQLHSMRQELQEIRLMEDKTGTRQARLNNLLGNFDKHVRHSAISGTHMDWLTLGNEIRSAAGKPVAREYMINAAKTVDHIANVATTLVEGARFAAAPEAMVSALIQLDELASISAAALSGDDRTACDATIQRARSHVLIVGNYEKDQLALQAKLHAIAKSADHPGMLNLHESLAEIKSDADPARYVRARQALDHLLAHASADVAAEVLTRVCRGVQPASLLGKDQTFQLEQMHHGDEHVINALFSDGGARLHGYAWHLKAAAIDPGDDRALKNLAVRHNLSIARSAIARAIQFEQDSWKKGMSRPFRDGLPYSNLPNWLMGHARGLGGDRHRTVAHWISLSCHDPETGRIDERKLQSAFQDLVEEGHDPARVAPYIQHAFRDMAAIVECQEQVCQFVRAPEDARLLEEMQKAPSIRSRVETLKHAMLVKATGKGATAATDGEQIAVQMRAALNSVAPHLTRSMNGLDRLRSERAGVLTDILAAAQVHDHSKFTWLNHPARVAESREHWKIALLALESDEAAQANPHHPDARKTRDDCLARLKFFNVEKLRENGPKLFSARTRGPQATIAHLRAIKPQLALLNQLAQLDGDIEAVSGTKANTDESDQFIERALRLAILQEAADSKKLIEFTPQAYTGNILKRMATFGFDPGSENEHMRNLLRMITEGLVDNASSLETLCERFELAEQLARPERKTS
jgi:hypothetical protein